MILAKDDIEKAVSWWAGKLMDHQPHSNGDDSFTSVAVCFLADTMRQSVTLDQLNTFKAALAKSIEEYAKSIQAFGFSIGSDYGPCKMLADAAAENAGSCGVMRALGFTPTENGTFRRSGSQTEYKNLTFKKEL